MSLSVLERETFPAGAKIFGDGEQGDRAYILEEGAVEVFKIDEGKRIVFGTLGPGSIFGEMALIDDEPRMASARAVEACTTIVVTRNLFEQKLAKTDPFIRGLLNIFAGNLRAMGKSKEEPTPDAAAAA